MKYLEKSYDLRIKDNKSLTKSLHATINCISRVTGEKFRYNVDHPLTWFEENYQKIKDERLKALMEALKPVTWSASSSITARQNYVSARFRLVNDIKPFLTDAEKKLVAQWIKDNSADLWD